MIPLKDHYKNTIVQELKDSLGLASVMAVPKVTKVTLNMGVGEAMNDKKVLERAVEDMTLIACLLYTSPSPRDATLSRMPSSA